MTSTAELPEEGARGAVAAPRPRRTQAERVAESDRCIMDAAIGLIATQGYSATTLEAIGAEAGYSRQLVAQRFGSKDRLLEAVISRHAGFLRLRAAAGRANLAGLAALYSEVDNYLYALNSPSVEARAFFVLMLESAGPVPQLRPMFTSFTAQWEATLFEDIRAAQAQGSLRPDVDARTEARLLIATLRGIRIQSMIDPEASDVSTALNTLKVALAERLLPRAPSSMQASAAASP